jgi:hypothetical protein
LKEHIDDFNAIMKGNWERVVIPQDNLIDVNFTECQKAFGADHKLFRNFSEKLL